MSILLTGGTGYLGSHLVEALVREGQKQVIVLVRTNSKLERIRNVIPCGNCIGADASQFEEILVANEVDTIIHCATDYGRHHVPRHETVETNLLLPLRLLDAAQRTRPGLVFINTDTMLDKRISTYSRSKRQFREWLEAYADALVCVNVALEHFFGPGDDETKFVSSVVAALLRNEPRIALTPGEQERDFIYVDDVVSAFLLIVRFAKSMSNGFEEFEVGRGQPVKLRGFVELAKRISGNEATSLDFGSLRYRAGEVMRIAANVERIRALGWRPVFDLECGLRRTIEGDRPLRSSPPPPYDPAEPTGYSAGRNGEEPTPCQGFACRTDTSGHRHQN